MIKLFKIYILFGAILFASNQLHAQTNEEIIKIDVDKKTISSSIIPFDRPIKLEIQSEEYSLGSFVDILKVNNSRGKKYLVGSDATQGLKVLYTLKLENMSKNSYQAFIPGLKPNKTYELLFPKKLTTKEINFFLHIARLKKEGKADAELKKYYDDKVIGLERNYLNSIYGAYLFNKNGASSKLPESIGLITKTWQDYKNSTTYYRLFTDLQNLYPKIHTNSTLIPLDRIQAVGTLVTKYKMDKGLHSSLLELLDGAKVNELVIGLRAIGSDDSQLVDQLDIIKRKANIDKNYQILDSVFKQLLQIKSVDNSTTGITQTFMSTYFNPIYDDLKKNRTLLDLHYKKLSKLLNPDFAFAELISVSSTKNDIKTKNGQQIIPDFGLINILAFENDGTTKYIPRPYVGVNFHFGGGIDKSLRLRDIPSETRNRFWLRSSLTLGVTIGKIDEGGFSDFYNGFSPAVGYGYRISDQIRLGTGVLLLKEEDRNPLIDKKNVEPAVYLNLTLDYGIFNELGKAASKLIGI